MPEILYNVTTKIIREAAEEWVAWMKNDHIPEMLATGCFFRAVILKLREAEDNEGPTYAVQYFTSDETHYELYLEKFSTLLRGKVLARWGDKIVSFRSVLEVVN